MCCASSSVSWRTECAALLQQQFQCRSDRKHVGLVEWEGETQHKGRAVEVWLSDMDSNHDKGLQRALCYHYTIGQAVAGT